MTALILRVNIVPVILLIFLTNHSLSAKSNRIAIQASAGQDYTLGRAETQTAQTYHLIEGKFFEGNVDDPSLLEVSFEDITQELVPNLERQNFFPEEDPEKGDLLIMVHYGATFVFTGDGPEPVVSINDYLPPVETASGETYEYELSRKSVAEAMQGVMPSEKYFLEEKYIRWRLLGMDDVFDPTRTSYEEFIQTKKSNEGRYFFLLTAFDLPLLRTGEKKVLWTTRYNVRMIGQPFDQAVKELNLVASDYFGKNFDGMISKRVTDDSKVEIGEIEVIGEEEERK